ncbi:MAG: hypothetical protein GXO83_02430 [Chlorobi bacterium]|nr:hypothetical protein [Chlorobiota bacterium]
MIKLVNFEKEDMKRQPYIFWIILAILPFYSLNAQVTVFPVVDKATGPHPVQVIRVEITSNYTIIDFYYAPRQTGTWLCINKNFYITPSGYDERKYMILAQGIDICPKMTKVSSMNNDLQFHLYFPRIAKGVFKIDAVESKNGLNFIGIHVNNNGRLFQPPGNDSVSVAVFVRSLLSREASTDSIEGLWIRKTVKSHYTNQNTLIEEHTEVPDTVAITSRSGIYHLYSIDGSVMPETITKLTGDFGYFYKKQIPEVSSTGSGYIEFKDIDHFAVSFFLPVRLARFELLGDYIEGDQVEEIQEYRRLTTDEMRKLTEKIREQLKRNHPNENKKDVKD